MKKQQFFVDFDIRLIQQLRLIHAIAEAGVIVSVPSQQHKKFTSLVKIFSFELTKEKIEESKSLSEIITINHKKPSCCIGDLCRSLVFPHEICSHCRSLWKDSREMKISFIGLATEQRKKVFNKWINLQSEKKKEAIFSSALYKLKEKFELRFGSKTSHKIVGQLHFFSSKRGRKYPTKAWDEQYYQILANSEFVLCPRGKSDWTYRFFEAILCGAIPVVEKNCEAYNGFKFHIMSESMENFTWTSEIAEYNYRLCLERITIPLPALNRKLKFILLQD